MTAREKELKAIHLLSNLGEIARAMKEHRWAELLALDEFVHAGIPVSMSQTDPALYRFLRQQITEYDIRGWHLLNIEKLRELANQTSPKTDVPK